MRQTEELFRVSRPLDQRSTVDQVPDLHVSRLVASDEHFSRVLFASP